MLNLQNSIVTIDYCAHWLHVGYSRLLKYLCKCSCTFESMVVLAHSHIWLALYITASTSKPQLFEDTCAWVLHNYSKSKLFSNLKLWKSVLYIARSILLIWILLDWYSGFVICHQLHAVLLSGWQMQSLMEVGTTGVVLTSRIRHRWLLEYIHITNSPGGYSDARKWSVISLKPVSSCKGYTGKFCFTLDFRLRPLTIKNPISPHNVQDKCIQGA